MEFAIPPTTPPILSQRGRVAALVCAVGVVGAGAAHHHHDGWELLAAVLAGVRGLLGAFVGLVAASVGAVGVALASGRRQLLNVGELMSAILAVVILLFHVCFSSCRFLAGCRCGAYCNGCHGGG